MLQAVKAMYKEVRACVSTPEGFMQAFANYMGVKQGCALSPLKGVAVGLSLCADESKLYSWSLGGLQYAVNKMASFSSIKGLIPNPKKTKILVWKKKKTLPKREMEWMLNGVRIVFVTEHVDLGLLVSQSCTAKNNWPASCSPLLIVAAIVKLQSIMRRAREIGLLSPKLMCRLFETLVRPSLTYESEIWGVELGLLDNYKPGSVAYSVEKVHLQYLNNLGVKESTSSTHVGGEFGRHPVVINI